MLVATDVAARGIGVDDVIHAINFKCPEDEKAYIHRIDRTARAGHSGTTVTLADWESVTRWCVINRALELGSGNLTETYYTPARLYADLNIPTDTPGYLPRSLRKHAGSNIEALEDLGGDSSGTSRNGHHHRSRDHYKSRRRPMDENAKLPHHARDSGRKNGAKGCSKKGEVKEHRKRRRIRKNHQEED